MQMAQEESTISTAYSAAEADTIALAREAVRAGLIKQDVLDHLTSLHPQVPSSMKYRHFLIQLKKSVEVNINDEHFFTKMVQVLLEFQPNQNLENIDKDSASFSHEHIPELVEFLANYAYKWELLGTALKFQPQDLSNIEANNVSRCDFVMRNLISLLEEWIGKKYRHTLPPTKGNLIRALNSVVVGLGTLACELNKMFITPAVHSETMTSSVVSLDLNMTSGSLTFTPTYSRNMKIHAEENGSCLLEIQTTTYQPNRITYQWLVNEIEIPESTVHTGTTTAVLCISNADIEMDGFKYECTVLATGPCAPRKFKTEQIILRVDCPLDMYTYSLARMYIAQPEVPRDTWPPVSSKKYINLALIRQKQTDYASQYARLTIRGNMDDILQHKEVIEYDQVILSLRCGQLILIEGRPGSGKTTLVQKITRDWAVTGNGGMRLVLLVSLRVLNHINNPNLNDILNLFMDLKVSKDEIEERNGKGVCFIFDSLDEYLPSATSQKPVIHRIIDKEYLGQSTVIVASRPAAIVKLRCKADKVIEVVGFRKEQIFEYFDHYPFSDQSKFTKLKAYLSVHPNILHMCYLPVHAAMVGHLFEVTGGVPQTETEIYTLFTRFTLMHNNKSESATVDVHNLSMSGEDIYKFALERTLLNEQVLHRDEVTALLKSDTALGLATVDRTADLYDFKKIYTFLQEYLAAYYISTLSDEEQHKLIQEHGNKDHMLAVWKFYCGLVKFDVKSSRFKALLSNTSGKNLFHVQCAYESQQSLICTQLLKSKRYHMQLNGTYLTTPDFTAMGYIINASVLPVTLSLTNCKINFEAIDAMMLQMQDKTCLLKDLCITSCDTDMECVKKLLGNIKSVKRLVVGLTKATSHITSTHQVQLLADGLKECTKLEELDISGNYLECGTTLATGLTSCSNLQIIRIHDNNISADGISAIFKEIRNCKLKVKQQDITKGNNITNADFIDILQHCTNLQSLEITLCTQELSNLCSSSKSWQSLTELKVYRHLLSEQVDVNFPFQNFRLQKLLLSNFVIDGGNLANRFSHYPNLQILDLSNSKLIDKGVETICKSLKHCTRLMGLYLNNCTIGLHGVRALSLGLLHFCKNLQTLELRNNSIGEKGAKALAANLQYCTRLKILDLTFNQIGDNGAKALIANIHQCFELEKLALNLNEISEDGAKALATKTSVIVLN